MTETPKGYLDQIRDSHPEDFRRTFDFNFIKQSIGLNPEGKDQRLFEEKSNQGLYKKRLKENTYDTQAYQTH